MRPRPLPLVGGLVLFTCLGATAATTIPAATSGAPTTEAQAAPQVIAPFAPGLLGPGESFGFQAKWGVFPRAGRVEISATSAAETAPTERKVTVRVASDGTISRLYRYEAVGQTRFDTESGQMLDASYRARVGKKRQQRSIQFDHEARIAHYRDALEPARNSTIALPAGEPIDLVTSLVTARRWLLAPGESREILVQVENKFYPLRLRAGQTERLRTARGEFTALVITPEPVGSPSGLFRRGGSVRIWLEDSPARLPLRVEVKGRFGTVTADLVDYTPPEITPPATPLALGPTAPAHGGF